MAIIPAVLFFAKPETIKDLRGLTHSPANTAGYYFLTQFKVLVTYMRLLLVPLNQNFDYDYRITQSLADLPAMVSFLFLATVIIFAIIRFSRNRLLSFGIFWFFLTLLPKSSIIPLPDVIYEHRLYLAMVGYSLFLVSGLYYLFKEKIGL